MRPAIGTAILLRVAAERERTLAERIAALAVLKIGHQEMLRLDHNAAQRNDLGARGRRRRRLGSGFGLRTMIFSRSLRLRLLAPSDRSSWDFHPWRPARPMHEFRVRLSPNFALSAVAVSLKLIPSAMQARSASSWSAVHDPMA
jgi:hypothetical protein